jgi:NDP-4-keto-2,6-dideoxyhexose 3-C-methyltransferase
MYGSNYGYRSGLNGSMVDHLNAKALQIKNRVDLAPGDLILDIGSNDGTLLGAIKSPGLTLVGMDPTAEKFRTFYPPGVIVLPDFFSATGFRNHFRAQRAKVVTSISMFYDLDEPLIFMKDIAEILSDDGIWVVEQSYLPLMLANTSYDTVCHEHQEYYALRQLQWMADRAGLKLIDVELNSVNGGSFSVTMAHRDSAYIANTRCLAALENEEKTAGIDEMGIYRLFAERTLQHRTRLRDLLQDFRRNGLKVFGYGASTKGNVILQYCGLTVQDLPFIAEVNLDKFGCYTPGTHIPIISEEQARSFKPDAYLVLPWHFRDSIVARESNFLQAGGRFIFPLPSCEVVAFA